MVCLAQITVSIVLLAFLFWKIPVENIFSTLQKSEWILVVGALCIFAISIMLNSYKWQTMLRKTSINLPLLSLTRYNLLALLYGILLPGQIAGEVLKAYHITRTQEQKVPLVASIIMDKASSLAILFSASVFLLPLTFSLFPRAFWLILGVSLGGTLLFTASLFVSPESFQKMTQWRGWAHSPFWAKVGTPFLRAYQRYANAQSLTQILSLSSGYQFLSLCVFVLISQSFGIDLLPQEYIWVFTLASIALFLPLSFAGIGVREGALVVLFQQFHVSPEKAVAVSLCIFSVTLLMGVAGLFVHLIYAKKS